MRVSSKGQVTIPQHIRRRLGLTPGSEVAFTVDDRGRVVIEKVTNRFARLRGAGTVNMTTEEIMALTRPEE